MKKNLIINFHVVNNAQWFETLIVYLKSKYKMVSLSYFEDINHYKNKNSLCHITFDDGDISFYDVVFPVLKKHNIPATIFVSPRSIIEKFNFWFQEVNNYDASKMFDILVRELKLNIETTEKIDYVSILKTLPLDRINDMIFLYQQETNTAPKSFQNLDLEKIKELQNSKLITIGAHTLYHPILKNETDERIDEEISKSITELSDLLGEEVRYFAYPNGTPNLDFGLREIDCLKKNGIQIAVSTEPNFVNKKSEKMAFPRIGITKGSIRFVKLRLFLGPKWRLIKSLKQPLEKKQRENPKKRVN